jgi:hypothetical protein
VGCEGPNWQNRSIWAFTSHTPRNVCSIQGFLKPPIHIHPEDGSCIVLKVVPGSYNETSLTSSHDGNQVMNIKAEVTEDPELITFPVIKPEHEVSCTFVCSMVSKLKNISDKCLSLPWQTLVSAL